MNSIHRNEKHADFKSGFVAIAGAPNAGKSTLLNRMLGEKISITSKKPQTTRNRILGVIHRPSCQIVIIDTPGIHRPKGALNTRIVDVALSALEEVDLVLVVVDVANPDPAAEDILIRKLRSQNRPVVLALNKIDLIEKENLLEIIDRWSTAFAFEDIIPISAQKGTQVDTLIAAVQTVLPQGPPFYPEDAMTDLTERFIVAELIRERVFRLTGQEIPYAAAVTVDSFTQRNDGKLVKIEATLHIERQSQKGIIIGKNGSKLKKIGTEARQEIEKFLSTKVYLKLFVRVQKNWRADTRALRKFGY